MSSRRPSERRRLGRRRGGRSRGGGSRSQEVVPRNASLQNAFQLLPMFCLLSSLMRVLTRKRFVGPPVQRSRPDRIEILPQPSKAPRTANRSTGRHSRNQSFFLLFRERMSKHVPFNKVSRALFCARDSALSFHNGCEALLPDGVWIGAGAFGTETAFLHNGNLGQSDAWSVQSFPQSTHMSFPSELARGSHPCFTSSPKMSGGAHPGGFTTFPNAL